MGIDKTKLAIPTKGKIRDEKYLQSYRDRTCIASRNGIDICGLPAIAAHIRVGEVAGIGTKPCDSLTIQLCWECHSSQHNNPEAEWLVNHVLKPMAKRQYREWKNNG